ncbi:MAG: hypothetical protein R6X33_11650 [Candidatus Brocadiia bacterium]
MRMEPADLARKLSAVQNQLRQELFEELQEHGEDIESIFDPYSYSPLTHDLRDKYLSRLHLIQAILQQLAHYSQGKRKNATRVVSVTAPDRSELVRQVNHKLTRLNGAKVRDVKFMQGEDGGWSALITYDLNPFKGETDEPAAIT